MVDGHLSQVKDFSLSALWCLGLAAFLMGCDASQNPPAGIYVAPSVLDFGLAADESYVEGEFQLVNTTQHPVQIVNTEVSCGCTEIDLSERVIPAGGAISLRLRADIRGRYGPQVFDALLVTDNRSTPAIRARLSGRVITTKVAGKIVRDLGAYLPGARINDTIQIPKGGASTIKVLNISRVAGGSLSAKMASDLGDFWECRISGLAPLSKGGFTASITLVADDESDWKQQTLLVRAIVRSRWKYKRQCYLGFVPPGGSAKKSIRIGDQFAGTPVSRKNPVVSAKIVSVDGLIEADAYLGEMGTVSLDVELKASDTPGPVTEKIVVALVTSDLQEHLLEFEIFSRILDD